MAEGIPGVYRTPAVPEEGERVEYGGPVTQKFLETVEQNNNLVNQLGTDVAVKNVNGYTTKHGLNKPRKAKHKHNLDRDIVFWTEVAKLSFNDATQGTMNGLPAWKNFRYDFPTNTTGDYFHDAYLPVVVTQIYNNPDLSNPLPKLTLVMTRIRTNYFKFDIYQLESGAVGSHLYLAIFAMGRRGDYWPDLSEVLITPNNIGNLE